MEFNDLLLQWSALGGFGALIAFLINILKTFKVVKPDTAPAWSAGFNIVGLAALLVLGLISPNIDIAGIDAKVAKFVEFGVIVFGYIVQLLGSKLAHATVAGTPGIGTRLT